MPSLIPGAEKPNCSEEMTKALKAHILRERARKKQEMEQEVQEERIRKEREARERQVVMTLGQTRDQITHLEAKLAQFKEEKHQLFLQLKKVLNEDDIRRKQAKENAEQQMIAIQTLPSNLVHQQVYAQQPTRLTPLPQQQQPQQQQSVFKSAIKRPRSPSPPPQVPVSMYHGYGYKQPSVGTPPYQGSPQKTPQYSSQPSAFFPVAPQELPMYYPTRTVFESPRPQAFHLEQKLPEHYALRTPQSHGHVIHPGSMPINPPQSQPKVGSITAGYPVRSQAQYQQSPAAASLYTAQSRPHYQPSGAPMNYQTRD